MARTANISVTLNVSDKATPILRGLQYQWRLFFLAERAQDRARRRDAIRDGLTYGTPERDAANYSSAEAWALVPVLWEAYRKAREATR